MRATHVVLAVLATLLAPAVATAHDLIALVKVREADVYVEAGFSYGKNAESDPAEGAPVTVTDANRNTVAAGKTDEKGVWTFPRPPAGTYTVVVEQAGHRAVVSIEVPGQGTAAFFPSRLDKRLGVAVGLAAVLGLTLAYRLVRCRHHGQKVAPPAE